MTELQQGILIATLGAVIVFLFVARLWGPIFAGWAPFRLAPRTLAALSLPLTQVRGHDEREFTIWFGPYALGRQILVVAPRRLPLGFSLDLYSLLRIELQRDGDELRVRGRYLPIDALAFSIFLGVAFAVDPGPGALRWILALLWALGAVVTLAISHNWSVTTLEEVVGRLGAAGPVAARPPE